MATGNVRLYFDAAGTQEINALNPDVVRKAVTVGNDIVDELKIYVKAVATDPQLEYENVTVTAVGDLAGPPAVTVEYAADDNDSPDEYGESVELGNGEFGTAVPIWRRAKAANMQNAFNRALEHEVSFDEYVAEEE